MTTYYEEYPFGEFQAESDSGALARSKAKVLYRERVNSYEPEFLILREDINPTQHPRE